MDSKTRSKEVIRTWLVKFAAITGKPIESPAVFDIWDEALAGISAEKIGIAFSRLLKTWHFPNMPLPADVRGPIDKAESAATEGRAEEAWQNLLAHVNEWCHPDGIVTFGSTVPKLSARVDHAACAAGGNRYLYDATREQLVWAKKRFIECYLRDETLQENQPLLPASPEIHALLSQLGEKKALRD
jgi:hypothetical protein